jgi:Rps23 Pro-64 3,4-dihydroxylase Tpa1-like proline 4-hydroxylase
MLNLQDIEQYKNTFNAQGYVVIDDLLDKILVEEWNDYLQNKDDWHWTQLIKNSKMEKDFNLVNEKEDILAEYNNTLKDYSEGRFCFSFKRINKPLGNSSLIDEMRSCLSSHNLISIFSKIGHRKISTMSVFYINRFDKGDFITTHSDRGAGRNSMGVVVNLTKEWNPNHGGLTFMLDQESSDINGIVKPKLGRVLVFDIMEKHSPHFVSMVTSNSTVRRIGLVARYH